MKSFQFYGVNVGSSDPPAVVVVDAIPVLPLSLTVGTISRRGTALAPTLSMTLLKFEALYSRPQPNSAHPEERQDSDHDHDQAHEINDLVHVASFHGT